MKKRIVPAKNIDPVLVDIRKPGINYKQPVRFVKLNLTHVLQEEPARFGFYKKFLRWGTALVVVVFILMGTLLAFNLKEVKALIVEKGDKIVSNFTFSVGALRAFEPAEAGLALKENTEELSSLNAILERPQNRVLFSVVGSILPAFKEAGAFLSQISALNLNFLELSEALNDLKGNGFYYFQNDGQALVDRLEGIRGSIQGVTGQIESIRNTAANLKSISSFFENVEGQIGDQYLKYSSDLHNLDSFLGGLLALIDSEDEIHILLLFQNPAEIRPGGGFIGSYADLQVERGQMTNLEVQDIYWPDHPLNLELKVIPPDPLQLVTKDWGARDANWFFDFPTSARTVTGFLENSKLYKEQDVTFKGVIALNINVMETILGIIGPVPIEEYDLVVDRDNFLIEIQKEVETGRDKKKGENPKKVLSVLTPLILERLDQMGEEGQRSLIDELERHITKKDIMIFAKEGDLAAFLNSKNIDGAVYPLPSSFWGSYLAVVDANIAGGKSDAFVRQRLEVRLDIDTDGGVFTDLTIERKHEGDKQEDPWWRKDNQNFIQIFTNPASTLVSLKGNSTKSFRRPDYDGEGYAVNADLQEIEETRVLIAGYDAWSMEAHGKSVFATWFTTPAGKTRTLNLRYQTPSGNQVRVSSGKRFRFIFERQSGVKSNLRVTLGAPLGYVWSESNSPIFIYEDEDPDARVILDLTLRK
ncbi:MAG: DUF4012 domain-containing protein [Patescibacteria group bacterium]|nr:DUF4012 domain-containing protein [Patescibacteria group bacterium]